RSAPASPCSGFSRPRRGHRMRWRKRWVCSCTQRTSASCSRWELPISACSAWPRTSSIPAANRFWRPSRATSSVAALRPAWSGRRMKIAAVLALLLAACSGESAGDAPDAGPDSGVAPLPDAGPFDTAAHVPFPQMPSHGGTTLPKLQLVTVTFQGYPYRSFVESFGDFVVNSQWLAAVTQDYGPLTATHLAKYALHPPPNPPDSDFAAELHASPAA